MRVAHGGGHPLASVWLRLANVTLPPGEKISLVASGNVSSLIRIDTYWEIYICLLQLLPEFTNLVAFFFCELSNSLLSEQFCASS